MFSLLLRTVQAARHGRERHHGVMHIKKCGDDSKKTWHVANLSFDVSEKSFVRVNHSKPPQARVRLHHFR